jgi:hypothetical protein
MRSHRDGCPGGHAEEQGVRDASARNLVEVACNNSGLNMNDAQGELEALNSRHHHHLGFSSLGGIVGVVAARDDISRTQGMSPTKHYLSWCRCRAPSLGIYV